MHRERVVLGVVGCGLLLTAGCVTSEIPPATQADRVLAITLAGASASTDAGARARTAQGAYGAGRTLVFASGPEWESFGGAELEDLGPAREVCVNGTVPMDCPSGALRYRYSVSQGWTAFNGLPNVHWIWLGNVARAQRADHVQAQFAKSFTLGANPRGRITVAADDFAVVYVNQVLVGAVGSTSVVSVASNSQNSGAAFDLTSALRAGENTIAIVAKNGPPSFASCPNECTYDENPAGVAFTGTLSW